MEGAGLMNHRFAVMRFANAVIAATLWIAMSALATGQEAPPQQAPTQESPPQEAPVLPSEPGAAKTHVVIVVGAGGTPEYAEQFAHWADQWKEVAAKTNATVTLIGQANESDQSDRQQLEAAIQSISSEQGGPVWIVMIGHGTYAQSVAKFNLRGPDLAASDLAEWLQRVSRTVVVVDCASASGPFVNELSGKNRVIVTATKSGSEQNYARFGEYFAAAISSSDSDLDHDDEVSVHEAFLRASAAVQQFYETEARISTEHALIDDNGDGRGTPAKMFRGTRAIASAKDGTALDGKYAARITLSPAENRLPFTADELNLRADIEGQLDRLRNQKDAISEEQYDAQLEPLMLRLAKLYQAAEQRVEAEH